MTQIFAEFCPHLMHVPTNKPDEISEAEYVITDGLDYIIAISLKTGKSLYYSDPNGVGIGNGIGFGNGHIEFGEFSSLQGFGFGAGYSICDDVDYDILDGTGLGVGGGTVATYSDGTGSDDNTFSL